MCQCEVTHTTVCGTGRPYITDDPDPASTSLILDPYAKPPPCDPARCPGRGTEAVVSAPGDVIVDDAGNRSIACPDHQCCRLTVVWYRCLCCPDTPSAEACPHYVLYSEYRQLQPDNPLLAPLPHQILDRDALALYGIAPGESPDFIQFRSKLFAAGRRLLAARQRAADWMRRPQEAAPGGAGVDGQAALTQEAWQGYLDLLAALSEAGEAFRDLMELYFDHFEGLEGYNYIAAEFVESARRRRGLELMLREVDNDGDVMDLGKTVLGMQLG
ncbi:uncharacterized protein E0L32_002534 [Thyridium curvatum]|uniref:Uncharacterized protein n=1 Tax=Thyridium curvatum TaxID=1093900 RepID=A0A507BFJ2_9PEZI|nr:uncharacterized protein E0L32_002534 [Thyridium curvatum]TPX18677.1 hypothetical protein E0L32_002534 [Thyridium curvatum]